MSLIILFGLPGTGKTYVGKVFEKYFDYYFYDGDNDLTPEMREAIQIKDCLYRCYEGCIL